VTELIFLVPLPPLADNRRMLSVPEPSTAVGVSVQLAMTSRPKCGIEDSHHFSPSNNRKDFRRGAPPGKVKTGQQNRE
jgi:hypothetical protein